MPQYEVSFDYFEQEQEYMGEDPDTGEAIYEDVETSGASYIIVEAEDEADARDEAYTQLAGEYDSFDIWDVDLY